MHPECVCVCVCVCVCTRSVAQSCLTLCDPVDCSPPGPSILQQEYWVQLPCPPPGRLPDPGIKSRALVSTAVVMNVSYHVQVYRL